MELTLTDSKSLRQSGLNLDVPLLQGDGVDGWALWTPPHPGFVWNHHIHTEDEVYEYNVTKEWPFPDHLLMRQVVFAVRELDKTDCLAQLVDYWDNWVSFAKTKLSVPESD